MLDTICEKSRWSCSTGSDFSCWKRFWRNRMKALGGRGMWPGPLRRRDTVLSSYGSSSEVEWRRPSSEDVDAEALEG